MSETGGVGGVETDPDVAVFMIIDTLEDFAMAVEPGDGRAIGQIDGEIEDEAAHGEPFVYLREQGIAALPSGRG